MKIRLLAAALVLTATPALAQTADGSTAKPAATATQTGDGAGVVKAVNAKAGSVTLHHGPIAALGWPAMTMTFKADPALLKDLKPGQSVRFTVKSGSDADEVVAISPQ